MVNKGKKSQFQNLWGDNHPEKTPQRSKNTIGFKQQLSGLFNPDKMINTVFGGASQIESVKYPFQSEAITPLKKSETIFSFKSKDKEQKIAQETQIILSQLKQQISLLEKSGKSLGNEIAKIKVEQLPQKSSIYYLIFFEWLIGVVKQLRIKVEEGRSWLATFTKRQKKRLGYWGMYKKHGTTFGLSHERTLATMTG